MTADVSTEPVDQATETEVVANPLGDWESLNHDEVTRMLANQVAEGFEVILSANEVLLESDSGTGVREIDKMLKEYDGDDAEVTKAKAAAEKAQKAFKTAQEKARNLVRTNLLKEDEVAESDIDKDAVKKRRNMVMDAINLLTQYADNNDKTDVLSWAKNLSVPQVGRQGSSTVGQKKPRARVTVDGHIHESFGEAAKYVSASLSSDENSVVVSSGDLVTAWSEAGEAEEFDFRGHKIGVAVKTKAA